MPIGRRFGTRHPCRAPEPEAPAAWFVQCEVIPSDMARGPAGRLEVGREYSGPLWLVNISFASRKSRPKNLQVDEKSRATNLLFIVRLIRGRTSAKFPSGCRFSANPYRKGA